MENINLELTVKVEIKDGRANIKILTKDELNRLEMLSILSGGIGLIIRSEESPEKQGKMFSNVVKYLESELVNVDSFSDAYFYKK
jgi:hypothetical protein